MREQGYREMGPAAAGMAVRSSAKTFGGLTPDYATF
jgi:hypothetical protein